MITARKTKARADFVRDENGRAADQYLFFVQFCILFAVLPA